MLARASRLNTQPDQPKHDNLRRSDQPANTFRLHACIAELEAMRYTPAGLPALNLVLEHNSQAEEAGHIRQVKLQMKSVAVGAVAERLARQAPGSQWNFSGFLASSRNAKSIVFHIQDFLQN
jgi:primosomal replication protein N